MINFHSRPLSVTILALLLITNLSFAQNSSLIASCCSSNKGRCTGSDYCTACTNCSRCAYCNSGGTCGVCARRKTSKSKRYNNQSSKHYSSSTYNRYSLPDNHNSEYYLKTLLVNSETLNLREGPSTSYGILQKLKRNQELIFLAMTGEWVKVKVKANGIVGFVHYKYITVVN